MERRKLLAIGAGEAELRLAGEAAGSAWELLAGKQGDAEAAVVFGAGDELPDLLRDRPGMRVVVVLPALDRAAVVRAVKAGAADVLAMPVSARELSAALSAAGRDGQRGAIRAVLGATGGAGATTLAVNLADHLARRGASAALVDLDVELGAVAHALDLKPAFTLADVARNSARLDAAWLGGTLHAMPSSLRVLPAPLRLEEAEEVTPERLRQVLEELRSAYGQVLLDVPRSLGERTLEALDCSDQILLLVPLDVPGLASAKRLREAFERLGYRAGKARFIAARTGRRGDVRIAEAQRALGAPFFHQLPEDLAAARGAMNLGKPIFEVAPRSALAVAIAELGAKLLPAQARAPRHGFLEKLHARGA